MIARLLALAALAAVVLLAGCSQPPSRDACARWITDETQRQIELSSMRAQLANVSAELSEAKAAFCQQQLDELRTAAAAEARQAAASAAHAVAVAEACERLPGPFRWAPPAAWTCTPDLLTQAAEARARGVQPDLSAAWIVLWSVALPAAALVGIIAAVLARVVAPAARRVAAARRLVAEAEARAQEAEARARAAAARAAEAQRQAAEAQRQAAEAEARRARAEAAARAAEARAQESARAAEAAEAALRLAADLGRSKAPKGKAPKGKALPPPPEDDLFF